MAVNKRTLDSLANLVASMQANLAAAGVVMEVELDLEQAAEEPINSIEELTYEAQAVVNFFTSRIRPVIEKDERELTPREREKLNQWRIRKCKNCEQDFAFDWYYDGVTCCSLECYSQYIENTLGIKYSRHHDVKQRWGVRAAPAIVPSTALHALRVLLGLVDASSEPVSQLVEVEQESHPIALQIAQLRA